MSIRVEDGFQQLGGGGGGGESIDCGGGGGLKRGGGGGGDVAPGEKRGQKRPQIFACD